MAALLFDLDGTLVNSLPDIAESLNTLLTEQGQPTLSEATVRLMIGNGVPKLVERAFPHVAPVDKDPLVRRFLEIYEPRATRLTRPFAGVEDTLARLAAQGHSMAVVTNKPTGPAQKIVGDLGLAAWLPVVVGSEPGLPKKPDPAMLARAIDLLAAEGQQALLVGDSAADAGAAAAHGCPCVIVSYGYAKVDPHSLGAEAVVDRFDALATVLPALLAEAAA